MKLDYDPSNKQLSSDVLFIRMQNAVNKDYLYGMFLCIELISGLCR